MRKRVIIPSQLKNFLFLIVVSTIFVTMFSLFIIGTGEDKIKIGNSTIPKFFMKSSNVIFNENNREVPNIKVYITKENKVEEMNLENYVKGVVAAEVPAEFNIEALKAQAVAARTFALAHMEEFGGEKYKSDTGANVCDTVKCQVFLHKEDRLKSWPKSKGEEYWDKITTAVKETAGEVLTYNGKIVMEPYYFAVSSGRTENAADVFSESEPYLKSVGSNGEESAPKYRSVVKISYLEFINKIKDKYPTSNLSIEKIKSQIEVKSRNQGGSVKEIKLGDIVISGVKFRSIIGLNSANFDIRFNASNIEINCIGYGHGVGMSQWGANAMAKSGKNYKQILTHYYSGVDIIKLNE